ncbi:MAG: adenine glycosylase [Eggerthellales bacterium]|nr:adenine glycosylase [Eggerthellales bacterium]
MSWSQANLPLSKEDFCSLIRKKGEELYRDLPWRNTRDAYEILVSEVMLQQTQVARVLTRWERFLHRFPTVDALASASTSDIVDEWQGMGYNRRALALKRCADTCAANYDGCIPRQLDALLALPGIGPATAAGVRAFAYNEPGLYLETNVRTVFLHELFPDEEGVSDKVIAPLVQESCPQQNVRSWYYALLDYGAHLKATVSNPSRRSKEYNRQSKFEGSRRQKRAEIVRLVLACPGVSVREVLDGLNAFEAAAGRDAVDSEYFKGLLFDLQKEGFFTLEEDRLIP